MAGVDLRSPVALSPALESGMKKTATGCFRIGAILLILGTLVGCAKPPYEAQKAAEAAMEAGMTAQADVYSASVWNEAKNMMDSAEAKMKKNAYAAAGAAFIAAKDKFVIAIGQVETSKKAMTEDNADVLKGVEELLAELNPLAAAKTGKLDGEQKKTWDAESALMREAIENAKNSSLTPPEARKFIDEARFLVEKWLGIFKK